MSSGLFGGGGRPTTASSLGLGTLAYQNAATIGVSLVPSGTRNLGSDSNPWNDLTLNGFAFLYRNTDFGNPLLGGTFPLLRAANGDTVALQPTIGWDRANQRFFFDQAVLIPALLVSSNSTLGNASTDIQTLRGQVKMQDATTEANAVVYGAAAKLWEQSSGILRASPIIGNVPLIEKYGGGTLTAAESGAFIFFDSFSLDNLNLPAATVGLNYEIQVGTNVDSGSLVCNGTDKFRVNGFAVGFTNGVSSIFTSTAQHYLRIVCLEAGFWSVIGISNNTAWIDEP